MDRPVIASRHVPPRVLVSLLVAGVLIVVVATALALAGGRTVPIVAEASPTPTPTPTATPTASPTGSPTASPSAPATASPTPDPADALLGVDGRLTVLLLGSDYRPSHAGNRTDTIMVVSLNPDTGAVAAASIPRDTSGFPLGDGRTFRSKVNGLYQALIDDMGATKAGREMKRIVGDALGVEIDSYAVVGFEGVRQLVDAVGGVDVRLAKAVNDPFYWVSKTKRGVYFPAGVNHLNGDRALIFARTRKGDNDFERARRQQLLVAAAVDAVRERGLSSLPKLLDLADRFVRTDLPIAAAPALFGLVADAKVGDATRIVFGPTKWASSSGGTSFSLKLGEVRGWIAEHMAPLP